MIYSNKKFIERLCLLHREERGRWFQ